MNSGVYSITNIETGKRYIGSTKNFARRFYVHQYDLKRNKHHSKKLQSAWNKYGKDKFIFEKIIICAKENLVMYEQAVLDLYKTVKNGYNILLNASSREGVPHSKQVVKKMTAFQRSCRKKYDWKGSKLCLSEIAEQEGVERDLLIRRVRDGWSLEKAVSEPYLEKDRLFTAFGKTRTIREWAEVLEQPPANFYGWLRRYDNFEDIVSIAKKWTINEMARSLDANPKRFNERIKKGWDIANALCQPNFYRYTKAY